ncbi:MAG: V-type ATP synthase subunit E [Candidatus Aegiribacteria sp.]
MSLKAILAKIEKDAELKARAIIEAAEREREKELKEHQARMDDLFQREEEKVRARAEESRKRMEFHVRREAERKLMNARRSMIDSALDTAVDNLASAEDDDYLAMISSLLEECDLQGEVEVLISESDADRITPEFLRKHSGENRTFVLSDRRHGERGGVIFRSGDISQNGTFPMIAELAHDNLVMSLSELVPLEKT